MKKRGFTLAELLGVIVIIGILLLITTPLIINRIKNRGNEAEGVGYELIYNAAEQVVNEDETKYPKGHSYCIKISELIKMGKLSSPVLNIKTGEKLDDKTVLVKKSLSGHISYNIYDSEKCEQMKEVEPIDILIDNTTCVGNNIGTNIVITYPNQIGTDYKHTNENGDYVNDSIDINNRTVTENYKKNTTIIAQFIYNGKTIKEERQIDNIDDKKPKIESIAPNGNNNWIKSTEITVNIKEEGCGLKNNQTLSYGWTTDKNQIPSTLKTIQIPNTNALNAQVKIPASSSANLTGTYYLYIMEGIEDIVGNKSEKFVSGAFKFDNTPPSCGTWTGERTAWANTNTTIYVGCTDSHSGCVNNKYRVQSFTSGTTKTKELSKVIKDKVGNEQTCSKTANVYIDKEKPSCSTWTGESTTWTKSNRTISVGCTDSGSGCKSNTYTVKSFTSGTTKTSAVSKEIQDNVGNKQTCSKTANIYVDKGKPTCGTWTGESTTWTNSNRTIAVGCTDTGSGCTNAKYTVKSYTSGSTRTDSLSKIITDNVGNEQTCSKTANIYVDKIAPTISYSTLSGTYKTETLPYKNYTFYYQDNSGGSGLKKFSSGVYFQAYSITDSGCNSGWKDAGGDLCSYTQNNNASAFWRAYRVKDNAGNTSKIVCSYLHNNGTYQKSGPSSTCTVNGKSFSN